MNGCSAADAATAAAAIGSSISPGIGIGSGGACSLRPYEGHNIPSSLPSQIHRHHPRLIASLDFHDDTNQVPLTVQPKCNRRMKRKIHVPIEQNRWWLKQYDSTAYPEPLVQPNARTCRVMYSWQEMASASISTCDDLHAWDLHNLLSNDAETMLLGTGTWRTAFNVRDYDGNRFALKMLRASDGMHGEGWFSPRNYEGARRDAIMNERLATPNPSHVLQTFGHCGLSGIFELADGGVLKNLLWYHGEDGEEYDAHWAMLDRLRIGTQIAIGLQEVHSIGGGNHPPFSTCDTQIDQILLVNGSWRVSDFNRGEMLAVDEQGEPCTYTQQFNAGNDVTRSPEEFAWASDSLTSAVDVFHLGSILYTLLTFMPPYDEYLEGKDVEDHWQIKFDIVYESITLGALPRIPEHLLTRRDPATQAMVRAVKMSLKYTAGLRATATQVAEYLKAELEEIERRLGEDSAYQYSSVLVPPRIVFYTSGGTAFRLAPRKWPISDDLRMSMNDEAHNQQEAAMLNGMPSQPPCRPPCNDIHQARH